jgi:hypothetical protein
MADGNVAGISGLIFSCREIFGEMSVDCIPKIRLVLENMREWQDTHPDGAWLHVELPLKYEYVGPPTEATITLPISENWMVTVSFLANKKTFQEIVTSLAPLLCQHGSTLKFRIAFASSKKKNDKRMYRMAQFRDLYGGLPNVMFMQSKHGQPTTPLSAVKPLVIYAGELKRVFNRET